MKQDGFEAATRSTAFFRLPGRFLARKKMHYRLSNRQRKELFIRGARLRIALPLTEPLDGPASERLRLAARLLPDVDETIVAAERREIDHEVFVSGARPAPESLEKALGAILPPGAEPSRGAIRLRSAVLIVTMQHGRPHREAAPVQWPGAVIL
ncbi:MAG: hypothetical protein ACYCQK_01570 [Acidiferrobacteraceae bacterium]